MSKFNEPAKAISLRDRSFLKLADFSAAEISHLLDLAGILKKAKREGREVPRLKGKNIALIFEKSSTRTRSAFEVAAFDQGANVTYIETTGSHLGGKETMKDTARVLGRMHDGIGYRGHGQAVIEELAIHAGVPVWNGLTTEYHPTQVLADLQTMTEHCDKPLSDVVCCFLGDGANNVCNSLMVGAARMGMDMRVAAPEGCQPDTAHLHACRAAAEDSGARLSVSADVNEAVKDADFLYTDVWVSMGEPASVWQARVEMLRPYQVTAAVMAATGNPKTRFMHCLPAIHNRHTEVGRSICEEYGLDGLEVTEEVFESEASVVFDQAENRLHTIKAVMVATLAG